MVHIVNRFNSSLGDLAAMADGLSAAPDVATFEQRLLAELARLAAEAGAVACHLVIRSGTTATKGLSFFHAGIRPDLSVLAHRLERTDGWEQRITGGRVTIIEAASGDAASAVLASLGVDSVWVVGGARSLAGPNHALFSFATDAPVLTQSEATSLSINLTLLISRAIGRLSLFEWEAITAAPSRDSYLFETDDAGMLVRWPFPIRGEDAHLAEQVIQRDRRPVFDAVEALLTGGTESYEMVVRAVAPESGFATLRLLVRRSPSGGVEGIVLPPEHPIAMLPQHIASELSPREREVASLIGAGMRVRQVTQRLYVSENTVRNHLKSIFTKLGLSSQAELVDQISRADDPVSSPAG